jgi:hypothetical protein
MKLSEIWSLELQSKFLKKRWITEVIKMDLEGIPISVSSLGGCWRHWEEYGVLNNHESVEKVGCLIM